MGALPAQEVDSAARGLGTNCARSGFVRPGRAAGRGELGSRSTFSGGPASFLGIDPGRELCRQAILKYLSEDDPDTYEHQVQVWRQNVKDLVVEYLEDEA